MEMNWPVGILVPVALLCRKVAQLAGGQELAPWHFLLSTIPGWWLPQRVRLQRRGEQGLSFSPGVHRGDRGEQCGPHSSSSEHLLRVQALCRGLQALGSSLASETAPKHVAG